MFNSIIRRVTSSIDGMVDGIVNRAIIVVPFLVAVGFATASLSLWLNRVYGAELGNLIIAGGFFVCGLICLALMSTSARSYADPQPEAAEETAVGTAASENADDAEMSAADRELLLSAITAATPIALPALLRVILQNWPLVAAIAAALVVFLAEPAQPQQTADENAAPS